MAYSRKHPLISWVWQVARVVVYRRQFRGPLQIPKSERNFIAAVAMKTLRSSWLVGHGVSWLYGAALPRNDCGSVGQEFRGTSWVSGKFLGRLVSESVLTG